MLDSMTSADSEIRPVSLFQNISQHKLKILHFIVYIYTLKQ